MTRARPANTAPASGVLGQQCRRARDGGGGAPRLRARDRPRRGQRAPLRLWPAQSRRPRLRAHDRHHVDGRQRARWARRRAGPGLHHVGAGRRLRRLALRLLGPNRGPAARGPAPDLVARSLPPDLAVGSHTASLGLTFYRGTAFPERYRGGCFIGQHGSWNRTELSGYAVTFVPFRRGRPTGPMEPFLTGFVADAARSEVWGRPCGVIELPDGSLLVADDAGDRVWRVAYRG